jgi:hypothetical protein
MKKLSKLKQDLYFEKQNKINNFNIELNIEIYEFLNIYYAHFTVVGCQKKVWETLLQFSEKFWVWCARTYAHAYTRALDVHTLFTLFEF